MDKGSMGAGWTLWKRRVFLLRRTKFNPLNKKCRSVHFKFCRRRHSHRWHIGRLPIKTPPNHMCTPQPSHLTRPVHLRKPMGQIRAWGMQSYLSKGSDSDSLKRDPRRSLKAVMLFGTVLVSSPQSHIVTEEPELLSSSDCLNQQRAFYQHHMLHWGKLWRRRNFC